ncbi:unnamed protein product [Trichobilharzia regenti]|nr:unnamed protein product [Trichobilharzia regenti]
MISMNSLIPQSSWLVIYCRAIIYQTILMSFVHSRRFLGPRENPNPSRCLGVFGLSLHTQERNLYDIFSQYGNIEDVQLVFDNYTGRSRGFGFVYFTHVADAKAAKADAHGMEIDGRPIRCDFSITERPHSPTPGIYMGKSDTSIQSMVVQYLVLR